MRLARSIGLGMLLALTLVFPLLADSATTSIAIFTLIFAIAATGWNLFSGYTDYFDLGYIVYYGLGAYALALACQDLRIPGGIGPLLLLPLAGVVAGACAVPLGWTILHTRRHTFMVLTLAIFFLFQLLANNLPTITNGAAGIFLPNPPWSADVFDLPFYYVALGILLAAMSTWWWVRHSKYGLGLLAIRDDEDRARGLGVRTAPFKLAAYVLSAFFLGMAGALTVYFTGVLSPTTVFDPTLNVVIIVMVFLGGTGTLTGPLVGAFLLEPLQQYLTLQFGALPGLNLVVYGAILLAIILLLPGGIVPSLRVSTWLRRWRQPIAIAREAWLPLARRLAEIRSPRRLPTARDWAGRPATSIPLADVVYQQQTSFSPGVVLPVASHAQEPRHASTGVLPVSHLTLRLEGNHQNLSSPASGKETATIHFDPAHASQFSLEIDSTRGLITIAAAATKNTATPSTHLLPREEWQRVLIEWNKTATSYPNCCVHHLFEEQARQHPSATAVVWSWQAQSYQALNRDANRLAHYLQQLGVGTETPLVICMERSLELITSILAVLKAGGAFLLVDPQHAANQLPGLLEHSGASLVLTQAAQAKNLAGVFAGRPLLRVDTEWQTVIAGQPSYEPRAPVTPGHTACMVMKEGSTDTLVHLSHEGIVNLHIGQRQVFALRPTDRILQFADLPCSAFLFEIIMALLVGATLVLAPEPPERVSTPQLQSLLQEEQITLAVLEGARWASLSAQALPRLRLALSWALSPGLDVAIQHWAVPGRRMLTLFGAAETTCWAAAAEWDPNSHLSSLFGRPVANRQIYVLDPDMRPVAIGAAGQIYIGGVGLGHYHRHHDLNLQSFPPDPFHASPTAKLYRTGQIGRWRQDGLLEFLSRETEAFIQAQANTDESQRESVQKHSS